ncbi:MAG: hypothetical protein RJA33_548 [Actinomycetota bacterium]|jgi:hypothetical protein
MSEDLQSALLAVIALALVIANYSLFRIARRLRNNANRNSRETKGQTTQILREINHTYHQIEALEQLLPALKLTAPLPASRGWAASPDFLLTLSEVTRKVKPKLAVELGSGVSTLVLAKSGAKKIISLDHTEEFGQATRELLKDHKVSGAEIRIAPLEDYPAGYKWYAHKTIDGIRNIDLLVIDGPPSSTNSDARYPALEFLLPVLSKKATIILDDADRDDEKKLAEDIAKALPNHKLTFLRHEKGTALIRPL